MKCENAAIDAVMVSQLPATRIICLASKILEVVITMTVAV